MKCLLRKRQSHSQISWCPWLLWRWRGMRRRFLMKGLIWISCGMRNCRMTKTYMMACCCN
uniref:Uncharacterized protein n=1 Tax=Arundo donax TaxID=35708 RepID=A0A0A9BA51_ARUDO